VALAAKREREIREAATLARAEKAGLMASSISKFNSELRRDETPAESVSGKKRSNGREERELEEAKKERDALRY